MQGLHNVLTGAAKGQADPREAEQAAAPESLTKADKAEVAPASQQNAVPAHRARKPYVHTATPIAARVKPKQAANLSPCFKEGEYSDDEEDVQTRRYGASASFTAFSAPEVKHVPQVGGIKNIHWAAQYGDLNSLRRLCEANKGAENCPTEAPHAIPFYLKYFPVVYHVTPLMYAAASNKVATVTYLLTRPDINPDLRDSRGLTARDYAATNGHTKVLEVLDAYNQQRLLSIKARSVSPESDNAASTTSSSATRLPGSASSSDVASAGPSF